MHICESSMEVVVELQFFYYYRHDQAPNEEQTAEFINVVSEFSESNPQELIGMINCITFMSLLHAHSLYNYICYYLVLT